jgi:hypothetical protein
LCSSVIMHHTPAASTDLVHAVTVDNTVYSAQGCCQLLTANMYLPLASGEQLPACMHKHAHTQGNGDMQDTIDVHAAHACSHNSDTCRYAALSTQVLVAVPTTCGAACFAACRPLANTMSSTYMQHKNTLPCERKYYLQLQVCQACCQPALVARVISIAHCMLQALSRVMLRLSSMLP